MEYIRDIKILNKSFKFSIRYVPQVHIVAVDSIKITNEETLIKAIEYISIKSRVPLDVIRDTINHFHIAAFYGEKIDIEKDIMNVILELWEPETDTIH